MKNTFLYFIFLLIPLNTYAAGAATSSSSLLDLLWKGVNFLLLVFLLSFFGKKIIPGIIEGQRSQQDQEWEAVEERLTSKKSELEDVKKKSADLKVKAKEMANSYQLRAKQDRVKLEQQTQEQVQQIQQKMEQQMQRQKDSLYADINYKVIQLALGTVVEKIKKQKTKEVIAVPVGKETESLKVALNRGAGL